MQRIQLNKQQMFAIATGVALTYLAITGYADDQAQASFDRQLSYQPGPAAPITRLEIDDDVLYRGINESLLLAAADTRKETAMIEEPTLTEIEAAAATSQFDAPVSLELNFVYHVDADMHEQDVFIERESGSGEVWRVTKADRDMSAPLYRAAEPVEHAPFEPEKMGPFPKGDALGITMGEWFAGRGEGTYTCVDGEGSIEVDFTNMVPNSAYTMWHFFVAMPPTTPFIGTYDLPIGARDGSQSVFRTDADGNASFRRVFKPCLQMTGEHLAGALAVTWHSDGKTYGVLPGEFATDSHVQLFLLLPQRSGI